MRHLLESWPQIGDALRCFHSIVLFLDFDGTLVDLGARPEDAALDPAMRKVLRRLAHSLGLRVYLISGRSQADLRERVHLHGMGYLGLHGWEGRIHGRLDEDMRLSIDEMRRKLTHRLDGFPGIQVEDKGDALAIHYRRAGVPVVSQARSCLRQALDECGAGLRVLEGDKIWEILPRQVRGKGVAARKQWLALYHAALPIYVGNDSTDEHAFQALARGVTIRVGPRRSSRAKFYLRSPGEVRTFLEKLAEASHPSHRSGRL